MDSETCDHFPSKPVVPGSSPGGRADPPPGGRGGRPTVPAPTRFLRFYEVDEVSGCWVWTGAIQSGGYGEFGTGGNGKALAHRWSYEHHRGPIPAGLTIDHLCRNRRCVNPDHLEPVPMAENIRRGISPSALNASKTHCKNGHEFSGDNLRVTPGGTRKCRRCQYSSDRNGKLKRRGPYKRGPYKTRSPHATA